MKQHQDEHLEMLIHCVSDGVHFSVVSVGHFLQKA